MSDDEHGPIEVGLAWVSPPRDALDPSDIREPYRTDSVLELAIREVETALVIYIDEVDKHVAMRFESELFDLTWDLMCVHGKEHLDISILSAATGGNDAWEQALLLPELRAVYSLNPAAAQDKQTRQLLGLLPVIYRSPSDATPPFDMDLCESALPSRVAEVVVVCGIFDHLHNGHKRLLSYATALCTRAIVVAITASSELLKTKSNPELIEPLEVRKQAVHSFIASIRPDIVVEFEEVTCGWGPTNVVPRGVFVISSSDLPEFLQLKWKWSTDGEPLRAANVVRETHRSTLSSSRIRAQIAVTAEP